jgi:hypothetical protein
MSRMSTENQTSQCNVTAYGQWYSTHLLTDNTFLSLETLRKRLLDIQRSDAKAWQIMNFDFGSKREEFIELYSGRRPNTLELSMGEAMELSTVWCEEELDKIWKDIAGGHGPPSNISVHDAMCASYCIASDSLRSQGMEASGCDCLELSTQNSSMSFKIEGDFCRKNSAAILCSDVAAGHAMCSKTKGCEFNDFSCWRMNYDMIEVPSRGFGNECISSACTLSSLFSLSSIALALVYLVRL